jgi:hypothetical protein
MFGKNHFFLNKITQNRLKGYFPNIPLNKKKKIQTKQGIKD